MLALLLSAAICKSRQTIPILTQPPAFCYKHSNGVKIEAAPKTNKIILYGRYRDGDIFRMDSNMFFRIINN